MTGTCALINDSHHAGWPIIGPCLALPLDYSPTRILNMNYEKGKSTRRCIGSDLINWLNLHLVPHSSGGVVLS